MTTWSTHARQWSLLGPPLRPSAEDTAFVETVVGATRPRRALVLGVTPETVRALARSGTRSVAVDVSADMIANVWPPSPGAEALRGDWRALPLEDGSVDLVTGDGATTLLADRDDDGSLFREARRVLSDGGRLVLRVFVQGTPRETPEQVVGALVAGRIRGFHAFKWRLNASIASSAGVVRLGDVWSAWAALVPDAGELLRRLGWSAELLRTIDVYRGSDERYSYPVEEELIAEAGEGFVLESRHVGAYELAERCPTLVFRAIRRGAP